MRATVSILTLISIQIGLVGCVIADEVRFERRKADFETATKAGDLKKAELLASEIVREFPREEKALDVAEAVIKQLSSDPNDPARAAVYFRFIVLGSQNIEQIRKAQRGLIELYYERLNDYETAINEIHKYLSTEHDIDYRIEYETKLARSYLHLNQSDQALVEINGVTKLAEGKKSEFEVKFLRASILQSQRRFQDAIAIYTSLMQHWPEFSIKENVPLALSVSYEEMNDFKAATQTLETARSKYAVPEFIDLRLKRLKDRAQNLPGAKGLRK